ncbi:MAG: phosphoribosylformylglycinamidine synthase subunit PurL [Deltaproteobacteria bacterium]|nr:phosphoribosylformylglycinamidine synthase subunit PurL [Deltaproteobacteria bacterium]
MKQKEIYFWEKSADESLARENGLAPEEFRLIRELMGRIPNRLELAVIGAMWSEHCSYKSSRIHLKRLPMRGPGIIAGPGGNAGAVDLGGGLAAVFKIESHNHPSYIEPYQGAATGVGGIIRDVIAMGARPIALLDSLRFGSLKEPRMRHLVRRVVAGIGDYGNSIGVPTVGGECSIDESYDGNILVNVFAIGLAPLSHFRFPRRVSEGDLLIYYGTATGRDGMGGAAMASESFDETGGSGKLPTVQVGDPFVEKLLIEITCELFERGLILEMQDMGAAGLTSSSSELAHRVKLGAVVDLNRVPTRTSGMTPPELMLSESQERMLAVVDRDRFEEVAEICRRWNVDVANIGHFAAGGDLDLLWNGEVTGRVPVRVLTSEAPCYDRPAHPLLDSVSDLARRGTGAASLEEEQGALPEEQDGDPAQRRTSIEFQDNLSDSLLRLLMSPNLSSREWIYRQYDSMVQTQTLRGPGEDAAVLRLKGREDALAIVVSGNGTYCKLSPRVGGAIAVAEGTRNLLCAGAYPIGMSNCLNFGNPEDPHVMWQLKEVIEGMALACERFSIPVVSGNVSLYNESRGRSIDPTPVVALVGQVSPVILKAYGGKPPASHFTREGDLILILGDHWEMRRAEKLSGSAYEFARTLGQPEIGNAVPSLHLDLEEKLSIAVLLGLKKRLFSMLHDCAEGGLGVALAEAALASPKALGLEVHLPQNTKSPVLALFGEAQSRIIAASAPESLDQWACIADPLALPWQVIGRVTGDRIRVLPFIDVAVEDAREVWKNAFSHHVRLSQQTDSGSHSESGHSGGSCHSEESCHPERIEGSPLVAGRRTVPGGFREECGVFGIFGHPDAARLAYLGIYALQHRGQEAAGIAAAEGTDIHCIKNIGLVSEIFDEEALRKLPGDRAIGHVRYSTSGKDNVNNAHPLVAHFGEQWGAIVHNGNLVDADMQRKELEQAGAIFQSTSDTEIILHQVARSEKISMEEKFIDALTKVRGAYSLALLTPEALLVARDPAGFRPLALGEKDGAVVIASESCAFDLIEAQYKREIAPGEVLIVSTRGVQSLFPWGEAAHPSPCIFEHVYFARPDSIVFSANVSAVRKGLGSALAREHPVDADLVVPVPDSGVPAAIGYSEASGIPFDMGIIRNHYIGRTFIEPQQSIRHFGVKVKLNPVKASIAGKRLVVVDDSLVRGTTSQQIITLLRHAGAREVHMRISSPPIQYPCVYGIDTPTREELVASAKSVEEIRQMIGADSLAYLSKEAMIRTAGGGEMRPFCTACFDGSYSIGAL